jgi:hypothetical protein
VGSRPKKFPSPGGAAEVFTAQTLGLDADSKPNRLIQVPSPVGTGEGVAGQMRVVRKCHINFWQDGSKVHRAGGWRK